MWRCLVVALGACGRLGFDPLGSLDPLGDGATLDGPMASGLIAHYKFDQTANFDVAIVDATGNGHDAFCVTGCPGLAPLGKLDAAYNFNGSSNAIRVADAPALRAESQTITLWVNLRANTTGNFAAKLFGTMTADSWQLHTQSGAFWTCTSFSCLGPMASLSLNTWHHVALVLTPTTHAAYLDGAKQDETANTIGYDGGDVLIGCDRDNNVNWAWTNGLIDDVRIYGRALADSEIAALAAQ